MSQTPSPPRSGSGARRTSNRNAAKSVAPAPAGAAGGRARRRARRRRTIGSKPPSTALHDLTALHELVTWAFGRTERDITNWPEGRRRVRSICRGLFAQVIGERPQSVPVKDVLFTTGLLARVLRVAPGVSVASVTAFVDQLGVPGSAIALGASVFELIGQAPRRTVAADRLAVGHPPEAADSVRAMVPNPPPKAPLARGGAQADVNPYYKEKNS